ncbi:MAG TPA: PAC2 family protein [Acidimicrobiia bacterium]|nr:PAC2 family protein [Acidimicrobiia bacterium]
MLHVETLPRLRRPILVVAIVGWVDAGAAGASAAAVLSSQLDGARLFARYPLDDLVDLQQTRPTVHLVDGPTREISWPTVEFTAGRAERDVVCCTGPEPSLRWPSFAAEVVSLAKELGVEQAVGLGGMPAVVSHRQPVQVLATTTDARTAADIGAMRTDYHGATGLQTVIQCALGDAGIPALGLWAQVPHYVSATPSPPAIRALLTRLRELTGVTVDIEPLEEQADAYTARVEEGLAERPDVAELVTAIEEQTGGERDVSGDGLADEIERFLRDQ